MVKKIFELRAKHPLSNIQIIERFVDGVKFMKVTPKSMSPMVMERTKQMFKDKPVEIEESENGWIKIKKLKRDEELEKAVEKLDDENINEKYVLTQEAEMLKKQGFDVRIKEI